MIMSHVASEVEPKRTGRERERAAESAPHQSINDI